MNIRVLATGPYAVVRLPPGESNVSWAAHGSLWSVTRAEDELSVVCEQRLVPAGAGQVQGGWHAFQLEGPIPFGLTGILAGVLSPLAAARIPIFAFSTYDTDYVMVETPHLDAARRALQDAGHVIL